MTFCERCGQNEATGHAYDVEYAEHDGKPIHGTRLCAWCAKYVGALPQGFMGLTLHQLVDLRDTVDERNHTMRILEKCNVFREFDLELDLLAARTYNLRNDCALVMVFPEEYTTDNPMELDDLSSGLQRLYSPHALMPGAWGQPLATPLDPDEDWAGGFAGNH